MTQKRMTKQRQAILQTLQQIEEHPTAEDIYLEVRKKITNISLGTVYRNLNILLQEGKIGEIQTNKVNFYDGNPNPHYHLQCLKCKRLLDIHGSYNDELDHWANQHCEGSILYHNIDFFGYCPECNKNP